MLHYRAPIVKPFYLRPSVHLVGSARTTRSCDPSLLASLGNLCYICSSHAVGVRRRGVLMIRYFALSVVLVGIMGCTSVQYNEVDCGTLPSDTFWSGNIALQCQEYRRLQAETAYRAEVAQSLKSYRECVSKHDGSLTGAKEQCSVYIQGLRDSPGGSSHK